MMPFRSACGGGLHETSREDDETFRPVTGPGADDGANGKRKRPVRESSNCCGVFVTRIFVSHLDPLQFCSMHELVSSIFCFLFFCMEI